MAGRRGVTGHTARVAAILGAALTSGIVLTTPASAAPDPAPSPTSPSPTSAPRQSEAADEPGAFVRPALTSAQVKKQLAQAAALQKQLRQADAEVAAAGAELAQLSARSSAAMSAVASARAVEKQAEAIEKRQLALLRKLSTEAASAERDVTDMAYDAYVNGSGELRDISALVRLASESGTGNQDAALVQYLAEARAADGRRYTSLAKAQQTTAKAAVAARLQRETATRRAVAAQQQVAASLAEQQKALAQVQEAASTASFELSKLGVQASTASRGVDLQSLGALASKPLCTQDTGTYANGAIPAAALCPIDGASGHMMRPAAARSLNALKAAYRKDMGSELCITDTYRSLAAQIDVKARKPVLAAKPGTSNHGLGLATDLCGGIESFGTPQHLWMQQHAPLFGFFHPRWAEPTGSKPEPWHWEFAL